MSEKLNFKAFIGVHGRSLLLQIGKLGTDCQLKSNPYKKNVNQDVPFLMLYTRTLIGLIAAYGICLCGLDVFNSHRLLLYILISYHKINYMLTYSNGTHMVPLDTIYLAL